MTRTSPGAASRVVGLVISLALPLAPGLAGLGCGFAGGKAETGSIAGGGSTGGDTATPSTASGTATEGPTSGATGTDTACVPMQWFVDADDDGFGDPNGGTMMACDAPDGHADNGDDCDDGEGGINPGAAELCNGFDDDCDDIVDEHSDMNTSCGSCISEVSGPFAYYVCTESVTWQNAEEACKGLGGNLASVHSVAEALVVGGLIGDASADWGWIGLNSPQPNVWQWSDRTNLDYDGWFTTEPNLPAEEQCGCANPDGAWYSRRCDNNHLDPVVNVDSYVCKAPA